MTARDDTRGAAASVAVGPGDGGPTAVPAAAAWLGAAGLIPFVGLAFAAVFLADRLPTPAMLALAGYGAVILSFVGGVHWGLATAEPGSAEMGRRLVAAVVPSLIGWSALLMPAQAGLLVLALAFAGLLPFDLRAVRRGHAPAWYPRLRWPLTIVVVASLVFGAVGRTVV